MNEKIERLLKEIGIECFKQTPNAKFFRIFVYAKGIDVYSVGETGAMKEAGLLYNFTSRED